MFIYDSVSLKYLPLPLENLKYGTDAHGYCTAAQPNHTKQELWKQLVHVCWTCATNNRGVRSTHVIVITQNNN